MTDGAHERPHRAQIHPEVEAAASKATPLFRGVGFGMDGIGGIRCGEPKLILRRLSQSQPEA